MSETMIDAWLEVQIRPYEAPDCDLCPDIDKHPATKIADGYVGLSFSGLFPGWSVNVCDEHAGELERACDVNRMGEGKTDE